MKSDLLKWVQLLCFFNLPSLLKERMAPILTLPFPGAKGWYQSSHNFFPAWKNLIFIFFMWHKTGSISVLRYDLQESKSSRSAPDSKPSVLLVTTAGGNDSHLVFGHTVHLTQDWNPQLYTRLLKELFSGTSKPLHFQ